MSIGFTRQEQGVVLFLALTLAVGVAVRGYQRFFAVSGGPGANPEAVAAFERRAAALAVSGPTSAAVGVDSSSAVAPIGASRPPDARIDINAADERALESVPGIGPALAGRIVAYRRSHGAFSSVDELRKVKGIGQVKLRKMMPSIAPIARK